MNLNHCIFFLILFILVSESKVSTKKKMVSVYGKLFECKSPKNSFERTRGFRTRTCIFTNTDKAIINEIRKKKQNLRK